MQNSSVHPSIHPRIQSIRYAKLAPSLEMTQLECICRVNISLCQLKRKCQFLCVKEATNALDLLELIEQNLTSSDGCEVEAVDVNGETGGAGTESVGGTRGGGNWIDKSVMNSTFSSLAISITSHTAQSFTLKRGDPVPDTCRRIEGKDRWSFHPRLSTVKFQCNSNEVEGSLSTRAGSAAGSTGEGCGGGVV